MAQFPVLPGINTPLTPSEDKQNKLAQASELKKSLLLARAEQRNTGLDAVAQREVDENARLFRENQRYQQDKQQREEAALVSDSGLDTPEGQLVQKLAGALTGAARIGGEAAAFPLTAQFDNALAQVPDEHRAIYEQERQYQEQLKQIGRARVNIQAKLALGTLTPAEAEARNAELSQREAGLQAPDPEQLKLLDQRPKLAEVPLFSPGNATAGIGEQELQDYGLVQPAKSSRQRIEEAKQALGFARTVDDAIQNTVKGIQNPLDKQRLDRDLGESWREENAAFIKAGEAWDKGDTLESGQHLAKGIGRLAQKGGLDLLENPSAVFDYVAENVPQLALGAAGETGAVLMAGSNLAYGGRIYRDAIEHYQAQHDGKLPTQDEASEMLAWSLSASAAEQVMDASFLKSLKGKAGASVREAIEQGGSKSLGEALLRTGQAGVSGAVGEGVTEAYQTAVEENLSKLQDSIDGEAVFKGAAIGAASGGTLKGGLQGISEAGSLALGETEVDPIEQLRLQSEDPRTSPEQLQAGLEQLNSRRSELESQLAQSEPEQHAQALEAQAAKLAQLDSVQARLEQLPDDEGKAQIQAQLEEQRAAAVAERDQLLELPKQREQLQAELQRVSTVQASVQQKLSAAPVNLKADLELADRATAELDEAGVVESREAGERLVSLAMASPEYLTADAAQQMADNRSNGLDDMQRTVLRRFAEAKALAHQVKGLAGVRSDIFAGNDVEGYKGLDQYQADVHQALNRVKPDFSSVRTSLAQLQKFAESRVAKQQVITQAFERVQKNGGEEQWLPTKQGWVKADRKYSRQEMYAAGGLTVHASSGALVEAVQLETRAVQAQLASLRAQAENVRLKVRAQRQAAEQPAAVEAPAAAPVQPTALAPTASAPEAEPQANAEEGTEPASREEATQTADEPSESLDDQLRAALAAQQIAEPVAEEQPDAPTIDGTLSLYGEEAIERAEGEDINTWFAKANLIRNWFVQRSGARDSEDVLVPVKGRPLVLEADFLSAWEADPQLAFSYLPEHFAQADENARGALIQFQRLARDWQQPILDSLKPDFDADFRYTDPFYYLVNRDENGQLSVDENLVTALTVAGSGWLAERAAGGPYSPEREINGLLGRDGKHPVKPEEWKLLGDKGLYEPLALNAMGQRLLDALGMKAVKAPEDFKARLTASAGAHIAAVLLNQGLLQRVSVSFADLRKAGIELGELRTDPKTGEVKVQEGGLTFLRPAVDFQKQVQERKGKRREVVGPVFQGPVNDVTGIYRHSGNILGALFGVENALREPDQAEPVRRVGTTNNTRQQEPAKLAEALAEDVKQPWQVRNDMTNLLDQLDPAIVERMVGIELDMDRVPKALQLSVQAKNDALRRDLQHARDFIAKLLNSENGVETLLYMARSVWKHHRVGMDGNVLNPQASKIARHLVGMLAWKTTVDPQGSLDGVLGHFMLAVMEGLGRKTDKQANSTTFAQFESWYQEPRTQQVLDSLVRVQWQGAEMTAAEQGLLLQLTQEGGEKLFSLDALLNASEYHRARQQGTTFETGFFREVDGKTNGSMLAHLQLMPFSNLDQAFSFLRRGGFYRKGDRYQHYSEFRSDSSQPQNVDIYEAVVRSVYDGIRQVLVDKPQTAPQFAALWNFIGHPLKNPQDEHSDISSDGRNLVKTPTTGVVYGSGMGGTLNGMKAEFQEKIFTRLHKLATGQAKPGDSAVSWLEDLNALLKAGKAPTIQLPADIEQLLEVELTPRQSAALDKLYGQLMYGPVKQAMDEHFGAFMARRNLVNRATRTLFHLYEAAYSALKQAETDRLMAAGELPYFVDKQGNKVPRHGLLAEQEQAILDRLVDLFPMVHSPFSAGSNDPSQGVPMTKSERSLSKQRQYQGQAQFSQGFVATADGKKASRMGYTGFERLLTNPGVAGMVLLNQSGDSAVSAQAYAQLPALNVHDAHGLGLADAAQGAKNLNQATFEVMAGYSMLEQVEASLTKALQGFQSLMQDAELGPLLTQQGLKNLLEEFEEEGSQVADHKKDNILRDFLAKFRAVREHAEVMQDQLLREIVSVDQYSMEGGAYAPDAEALARLDQLQQQRRERLAPVPDVTKLDTLLVQGTSAPVAPPADPVSDRFEEISGPVEQPIATSAAWGQLGQSAIAHDPELVAFFEANPHPGLKDTVKVLRGRIEAMPAGRTRDYYRELWKQLMQTVDGSVQVHYVTAASELPAGLDPRVADSARGLYAFNAREGALYVKSPVFQRSGITVEMLLHELTHAAVARQISLAEQGKASAEVVELRDDLQRLLERAREFTEQEGTADRWKVQLDNVQEFVAWGMTNPEFQREVLNRYSVAGKTGKNRLVQAAKAFVDLLRDLLFAGSSKSRQQIQVQALNQLLRDVGGLMQAAQEQLDAPAEGSPLQVLAYEDGDGYLDIDDLFDALGNDQPALAIDLAQRLKGVLDSVVKPLHGPFGAFRLQVLKSQAGDAAQQFLAAKLAGEAPLASRLQSDAGLSDQLAFVAEQVEVTVRTALDTQDRSASLLARELKGLYNEVLARVGKDLSAFHAGDWNQATAQEQAQAKALRDAFLDIPAGAGQSDYLSRFAALGLSHPLLQQLLQAPTSKQTLDLRGKTLLEKLGELVAQLARLLAGKLTHTWAGQAGDAKLTALVKKLVLVEARHRERLARPRSEWLVQLEGALEQVSERGRAAGVALAESKLVRQSQFSTVRVLGKVAALAGQERADSILANTLKLRERMFTGHYGFVAGMANEMKGAAVQFMELLRLAKHNEQHRKHLDSWTRQQVLESFANQGKDLDDQTRQALGYLLRTDVAGLFEQGLSLEELRQLLLQDTPLQQRIDQLSQQLLVLPEGPMYVRRAKALGVFLANQTVTVRNLGLNAKVIAEGHATRAAGQVNPTDAQQAEPLIDALASYQALLTLKPGHKQLLADLIQTELQRNDGGNGIEATLRLHTMLKNQSREALFQGRELHWMKGYLPEVTNPHIELAWADAQEGAELQAQGWEVVSNGPLQQDSLDRSNPRQLYRLKGRGALRWQSGALSLTGMKAKGFTLRSEPVGNGVLAQVVGKQGIADMDRKAQLLENQAVRNGSAPLKESLAVPLLDDQGNVVDYRYLMTAEVRDSLLQRNNDFAQLLGNLNAQTFDKRTATEQNTLVAESLHEHWQEAVKQGERAFITIGQDSPDREGREMWALLPEDSREAIRTIWGGDFMQVPAGQFDLVAGYRKLSAANAFDKLNDWMPAAQRARMNPQARQQYERDMRNLKEQLLVWLTRDLFRLHGKAALRVRQAEDIWQALVQEVKDIVVIRSGITLYWNVISNLTLLFWQGVPIKDMARNHWIAWRGAVNYRKDSEAKFRLENELQMGMATDPAEHRRKIRQLEDALSRNPARELIEAGMLPTIVEDVALDGDEYSYRSVAEEKLDAWTGWMPEQVKSTVGTLYMAPGTALHKGLSQATQYSDFIARYTLYQHLTQRSKAPLSHSEALERISDSFINYDVPSERQMQYLNDMGLFMFTKYYLRIQRVILQQFREKPVRGLLLVLLDNYLQGVQMIVDSGFWGRLGNPLEWGALQLPGALDELATVGGLTSLWK